MTKHDLTVATNIFIADGIGRQGIGLINLLKNDLDINVLKFQPQILDGIPKEIIPILNKPFTGYGNVTFWTYILGINNDFEKYHAGITSKIKIAYTMLESSEVPKFWVNILNKYYDIVAVPDQHLVNVYKKSGVTTSIFVLPLGIMIEDFLTQPIKETKNTTFTFGMTAGFWKRKNHVKLINAFAKKYKNDPNFKLKIHGRFGPAMNDVKTAFESHNFTNAEFSSGPVNNYQYLQWFKSIDCYIYPSQGEGFSITPRESMALGIPCILSNSGVHKTIIDSGFIEPLKADNKTPAIYEVFNNQQFGYFYDCEEDDLINRMDYVYNNYQEAIDKAKGGREWVQQYLWPNLKQQYLNIIKPKNIYIGNENKIMPDGIMTTSKKLKERYKSIK